MVAEREADTAYLEEMWALVDELGALSLRLKNAAVAAQQALGLPEEGTGNDRT